MFFPFAVLIVLVYIVVAFAVTARLFKRGKKKVAGVVLAGFVLLGTWDVILGRAAIWYECRFNAISSVPDQKIALPGRFFQLGGQLKVPALIAETPFRIRQSNNMVIGLIELEEFRTEIFDGSKGMVIASQRTFLARDGWLIQLFSASDLGCDIDIEAPYKVFVGINAEK